MRKGFTLIELLIVVTILSILAGAAVPYVQDYVDEARRGRAKADLDEIRNALTRYEVDRGYAYTQTSIASLGGPYLAKAVSDPWGGSYVVSPASSSAYSKGADGNPGGGDDVSVEFRPKFAASRVYWIDSNQNNVVDSGDSLNLRFSRPASFTLSTTVGTDFSTTGPAAITAITSAVFVPPNTSLYPRLASYGLTLPAVTFVPGSDTLTIKASIRDGAGNTPLLDVLTINAL